MRLSTKEIELIKRKVKSIFGESIIYLFGSRVDDTKIGGDIDLYIVSKINDNLFRKKLKLKIVLEDILYKPVDVVVSIDRNRLIEKEAMMGVQI